MGDGQIGEAEVRRRKAAKLQASAVASRRSQVIGNVLRDDAPTAIHEAEQESSPVPATATKSDIRHFELALANVLGDDREAADAALDLPIKQDSDCMAHQIAEVYAWRNERDKAIDWLQTSNDTRCRNSRPADRPIVEQCARRFALSGYAQEDELRGKHAR